MLNFNIDDCKSQDNTIQSDKNLEYNEVIKRFGTSKLNISKLTISPRGYQNKSSMKRRLSFTNLLLDWIPIQLFKSKDEDKSKVLTAKK